jgi:hypothetical protein
MEGKRFVAGLVGGLLVALALITASGGLGFTSFTTFNAAVGTATVSSSTAGTSTTLAQTETSTMTTTVSSTTTYGGTPLGSLITNVTSPQSTPTTSGTETRSISATVTGWNPANQSAATAGNSANSVVTFGSAASGAPKTPTRLASIVQQPIISDAEILAPVLVAFLLGAFLYRVAIQERQRSEGESPE